MKVLGKIMTWGGIFLGICMAIVAFICGGIIYYTSYRVETVETIDSPDGEYSLIFQAVGTPVFFGSTKGRILLMRGDEKCTQYGFELHNDGAVLSAGGWDVAWFEKGGYEGAYVLLYNSEARDELLTVYSDGKVQSQMLSDPYEDIDRLEGVIPDETEALWETETYTDVENPGETEDTQGSTFFQDETQPETLDEETQRVMDGYAAIYHDIFEPLGDGYEESFTAKGMPRILLSEDENTVRYLLYDRKSDNGQCGIYVYYEADKQPDGTWQPAEARICNMYAYVYEDGRVITADRTSWSDAGTDEYRQATGE